MTWELKETNEFEKQYSKLPLDIKDRFEEQFKKVRADPYSIGKTLGYKWFRELKNEGYRLYYLIYDEQVVVLFVGTSDKKSQQAVITVIKHNLKIFKEFIKK
jgi:mRNA-degrading endonuclease RelE of RelBE toxin-antitoxin system